jgi:ABC-2 type transport system ATP-binding protein
MNASPTLALDIQGLVKRYATKTAVDNVSLQIPTGLIYGLLGPNGAGKTSLIRMLTRITLPDAGRILFFGAPLAEAHQQQMGYMPEERGLYRKMGVQEQLEYLLRLKGLSQSDARTQVSHWLERLGMADWRKRKLEELSKGMSQKIQFIATVAHRPRLLILDEPFSGLDPVNAQLLEDVLHELRAQGTGILLSTHRMEQVEQLCQHIALIHDGQAVLSGPVEAVRQQFDRHQYRFRYTGQAPESLESRLPPTIIIEQHTAATDDAPGQLILRLPSPAALREVLAALNSAVELHSFEPLLPTIRDIFIERVTGQAPTPNGRVSLTQEA